MRGIVDTFLNVTISPKIYLFKITISSLPTDRTMHIHAIHRAVNMSGIDTYKLPETPSTKSRPESGNFWPNRAAGVI